MTMRLSYIMQHTSIKKQLGQEKGCEAGTSSHPLVRDRKGGRARENEGRYKNEKRGTQPTI